MENDILLRLFQTVRLLETLEYARRALRVLLIGNLPCAFLQVSLAISLNLDNFAEKENEMHYNNINVIYNQ